MGEVQERMRQLLTEHFQPTRLEITDDSATHAGHAGHDGRGESHFTVAIESAAFAGLTRVARQRAVNRVLKELLEARIHALALRATAPGE